MIRDDATMAKNILEMNISEAVNMKIKNIAEQKHLADNSFDESRSFEYFMFSPREAIHFDPYVTLATSLVLDYEAVCGSNYLPFMSGDLYEDAFNSNYFADGYAMTMLDRMGIQLPEDLSLESYRELIANLNRTTLFDSINPDAFAEAYQQNAGL